MFLRPDPAMDGLNHYAYSNCNPVMYMDPTGLEDNWVWTLIQFIAASCICLVANIISWCNGYVGVGFDSTIAGACALFADAINQATGANIAIAPQLRDQSITASPIIGGEQPSYDLSGTWNLGNESNWSYDQYCFNQWIKQTAKDTTNEQTASQSNGGDLNTAYAPEGGTVYPFNGNK